MKMGVKRKTLGIDLLSMDTIDLLSMDTLMVRLERVRHLRKSKTYSAKQKHRKAANCMDTQKALCKQAVTLEAEALRQIISPKIHI